MSIRDLVIQQYLKETYVEAEGMLEPIAYEVIQDGKVYKIGDTYIEFESAKDDEIYNFFISTEEDRRELGTVYKIRENMWTARAKDIPDIEGNGNDMIQAAIVVMTAIGEI